MRVPDHKQGFRIRVGSATGVCVDALHAGPWCDSCELLSHRLVACGEAIGPHGPLRPAEVLRQWLALGPACLDDIDGAFLFLFIPPGGRSLTIVTDRLNALKCFVERRRAGLDLVSSLCFLPARRRALDMTAVVSLLSNGVVFNDRTPLEGVRVLPRASIHYVSADGTLDSARYWELPLDASYATRTDRDLHDELAGLMLDGIRRRAAEGDQLYLSASGGYDSTCLLGGLTRIGRRPRTFSYSNAPAPGISGTDAHTAAIQASIAGVPHTHVRAFDGDPWRVVHANAELGECRANLCLEWDAWQRTQADLPREAILIVGDEWLGDELGGHPPVDRPPTSTEILAATQIKTSSALGPRLLRLTALHDAAAQFDEEMHGLVDALRRPEPLDTRSLLYVGQRLGSVILPWRELFGARCHRVRYPLLDRHLLEFTARLSPRQRIDRRIYQETAARTFPDLFAVPRAWRPDPNPWPATLLASRAMIASQIETTSSPLDAWLPPAMCLALLDDTAGPQMDRGRGGPVLPWLLALRILTLRQFAAWCDAIGDAPIEADAPPEEQPVTHD